SAVAPLLPSRSAAAKSDAIIWLAGLAPKRHCVCPGFLPLLRPLPRWLLCFSLAFLHEAFLGCAGEPPTVSVHCLALTGVPLAFFYKAGLGGADKWLAKLAHGLTLASSLGECGPEVQEQDQDRKEDRFHHSFLSFVRNPWWALLRPQPNPLPRPRFTQTARRVNKRSAQSTHVDTQG